MNNFSKVLFILVNAISIIAFVLLLQREPIYIPKSTIDDNQKIHTVQDENCLREALWHEIRNGDTSAMHNVADVILNRTQARGFPSTICEVVQQPKQFSYRNKNPPARDWQLKVQRQGGADAQALEQVKQVTQQKIKEGSTNKEILWYTTHHAKKTWMKDMKVAFSDGWHKFFTKKQDKK